MELNNIALATVRIVYLSQDQLKEWEKMRGTQFMYINTDFEDDGKGNYERVSYYLVQDHKYMFIDMDTIGIDWEVVSRTAINGKGV